MYYYYYYSTVESRHSLSTLGNECIDQAWHRKHIIQIVSTFDKLKLQYGSIIPLTRSLIALRLMDDAPSIIDWLSASLQAERPGDGRR